MNILITGIRVSGKSSLRRLLKAELKNLRLNVKHCDLSQFSNAWDGADEDFMFRLSDRFESGMFYLIEDPDGLTDKSSLPLEFYDLILYVKPDSLSYIFFWLRRAADWYQVGKFAWKPGPDGWKGTGLPKDWHNLWPISKFFLSNLYRQKQRLKTDLKIISSIKHQIVTSFWEPGGNIRFEFSASFKFPSP